MSQDPHVINRIPVIRQKVLLEKSTVKNINYKDENIKFGFTYTDEQFYLQLRWVFVTSCSRILAKISPSSAPLRSHTTKINKPLHFLKRQINMSDTNITNFIFVASNDNENALEVSYIVGHRVGKVKIQFCVMFFKLLKSAGYVMRHQFNIQQLYALPTLYLRVFLYIWEQTAICATYTINWLVFITEMKSVYSAVRTGALNKTVCALRL